MRLIPINSGIRRNDDERSISSGRTSRLGITSLKSGGTAHYAILGAIIQL